MIFNSLDPCLSQVLTWDYLVVINDRGVTHAETRTRPDFPLHTLISAILPYRLAQPAAARKLVWSLAPPPRGMMGEIRWSSRVVWQVARFHISASKGKKTVGDLGLIIFGQYQHHCYNLGGELFLAVRRAYSPASDVCQQCERLSKHSLLRMTARPLAAPSSSSGTKWRSTLLAVGQKNMASMKNKIATHFLH